jgi:long-chain acyl-CoA synthetase
VASEAKPLTPTAGEAVQRTRTIGALWRDAVAVRSGTAYLVERDGRWEEVSWAEAADQVEELAFGLLSLGIGKGDAFGILASTRLEWALFDFALGSVGAVTAPIYANNSARDAAYVLEHSDAIGVLVEDESQREKIANLRLEHELTIADLDELRARGRRFRERNPGALADAGAAIGESDLFTYIFTSGTTGPPKACMITHQNYHSMVQKLDDLQDFFTEDDVMLLYLPLAHNFGRLMHLAGPYAGYAIGFCPDPYRVVEALPHVRPTILPSVPRVYEKVHTAIVAQFDEETGLKRKIVDWALRVGRRASGFRAEGRPLPPTLAVQHRIADRLVYSKVKEKLGGRFRVGVSGGAPLAKEIGEFLHALDVLVLEGWGLTECTTAATVNRPDRFRFGTVGPALPGVEVKAAPDGELLIRSDTIFAGYYKDEEATRAVLDEDGWLRSGDVGEVDEDGFVRITDRKKDVIVTAGGKNVAPQNLENELKASKFVSQALVVGDRRPYLVALITLEEQELEKWHSTGRRDVNGLVEGIVEGVNREHSRFEQIKRFAVLPRDFTMEAGEVTPTLKLKRRVCEEHFADVIEELYAR